MNDRFADIEKIVLYGVGMMNGSLGMALRAARFPGEIVGLGRRAETLERAVERGAVDRFTMDPFDGLSGAALVVVGTPVDLVAERIAALSRFAPKTTIFTDVGSIKRRIVEDCRALAPEVVFIGAHPIAGSEKASVDAADSTLFRGAVCVLTPTETSPPSAVAVVRAVWEAVGATVLEMTPAEHDRMLALTSHLPHIVASALARFVGERGGPTVERFVGGGFRDTTRIAKGPVEVWTPILRGNAEVLAVYLEECVEELQRVAAILRSGDDEAISAWLRETRRARKRFDEERDDAE